MNEEIFTRLQDALQESLGVSRDRITPDARIIDDLGSDSLDMLDLLFALEEKFGIKIKRGQIEAAARQGMTDEEFAQEGLVTERGAERLRTVLVGAANPEEIKAGMPLSRIPYLFTVATFHHLVETKLREKAAAAPKA